MTDSSPSTYPPKREITKQSYFRPITTRPERIHGPCSVDPFPSCLRPFVPSPLRRFVARRTSLLVSRAALHSAPPRPNHRTPFFQTKPKIRPSDPKNADSREKTNPPGNGEWRIQNGETVAASLSPNAIRYYPPASRGPNFQSPISERSGDPPLADPKPKSAIRNRLGFPPTLRGQSRAPGSTAR